MTTEPRDDAPGEHPEDEHLEKEYKFAQVELEGLRERLHDLEAERLAPSALEDNLILDRESELFDRGAILRLRRDHHGARVTLKGPVRLEGKMRVRTEHEIRVNDAEIARRLFESLGYGVTRRYQKMREEWRLGGVVIALDHTPIGDFAEFEGEGAATVARRCGLDPERAERRSYLRLYEEYMREHPAAPTDMVFSG
jgi:adenylate cyclase class 2